MKKILGVVLLVILAGILVLGGCGKASVQTESTSQIPAPGAASDSTLLHSFGLSSSGSRGVAVPTVTRAPAPVTVAAPKMADIAAGGGYAGDTYQDIDRMIVRTGNIVLVVEDVPVAIDLITKLADNYGGYVVSSNVWEEGTSSVVGNTPGYQSRVLEVQEWKRFAGAISIRVPAERYDTALRTLRGMAVKVTSENSSSKDVTEEYTDLRAKLGNLEATETQLLKLMEKAEKVEDILNVQRELSSVRGNIEQTKGRMQYLEKTSSTSLIDVQLQQAKLDVAFNSSKTRIKKGETINFFPQIAGGITPYSYEWDFGDGKTSTDRSPSHAYNKIGDYTVTLKVTDDRSSSDIEKRTEYITVIPGWNAGSVAGGAWNGLVVFSQVLANIFIWLGIFSPVWIVCGGIAYWVIRRRKRARR